MTMRHLCQHKIRARKTRVAKRDVLQWGVGYLIYVNVLEGGNFCTHNVQELGVAKRSRKRPFVKP